MKYLAIAALLGLLKVEAIRFSEYTPSESTQVKLSDEDDVETGEASKPEVLDDSDVVIQIYDKNEENPDQLTPPSDSGESDEFL